MSDSIALFIGKECSKTDEFHAYTTHFKVECSSFLALDISDLEFKWQIGATQASQI